MTNILIISGQSTVIFDSLRSEPQSGTRLNKKNYNEKSFITQFPGL
jgi:hypothetical protein